MDVSLAKENAELPNSEAASKVAEAETSHEKGRNASMPEVHTSLPKVELSTAKTIKTDEFEGNIRRAAPEVKVKWVVIVELQSPNIEERASSDKVVPRRVFEFGGGVVSSKVQRPLLGISLNDGKSVTQRGVSLHSLEADKPKAYSLKSYLMNLKLKYCKTARSGN